MPKDFLTDEEMTGLEDGDFISDEDMARIGAQPKRLLRPSDAEMRPYEGGYPAELTNLALESLAGIPGKVARLPFIPYNIGQNIYHAINPEYKVHPSGLESLVTKAGEGVKSVGTMALRRAVEFMAHVPQGTLDEYGTPPPATDAPLNAMNLPKAGAELAAGMLPWMAVPASRLGAVGSNVAFSAMEAADPLSRGDMPEAMKRAAETSATLAAFHGANAAIGKGMEAARGGEPVEATTDFRASKMEKAGKLPETLTDAEMAQMEAAPAEFATPERVAPAETKPAPETLTDAQMEQITKGSDGVKATEPVQPELLFEQARPEAAKPLEETAEAKPMPETPPAIDPTPSPDHVTGADVIPDSVEEIIQDVPSVAQKLREKFTLSGIPRMKEVGVSPEARYVANSRDIALRRADELIAQVMPDEFKNPERTAKLQDVLNKDDILGGYRSWAEKMAQAQADAASARASGDATKAAEFDKQAAQYGKSIEGVDRALGDQGTDIQSLRSEVASIKETDPALHEAVQRYAQLVNGEVASGTPLEQMPYVQKLWAEYKGLDPNEGLSGRGEIYGARTNLLTLSKAEKMAQYLGGSMETHPGEGASGSFYRNPVAYKDAYDRAAKLTGQYSTDLRLNLASVLSQRETTVAKMKFYQILVDKGLAQWGKLGGEGPEGTVRKEVELPVTDPNGVTTRQKRNLWLRSDLAPEWDRVMGLEQFGGERGRVGNYVVGMQMLSSVDAVAHIGNLWRELSASGRGKGVVDDILNALPVVSQVDTAGRIAKAALTGLPDTPENRTYVRRLSEMAVLRPQYPATGPQKLVTPVGKFIHNVDTAVRVEYLKFLDEQVKRGLMENTPENYASAMEQLGQYNARLLPRWTNFLRKTNLGSFVVAGTTFNVQGIRKLTGGTGFKSTSAGAETYLRSMRLLRTLAHIAIVPAIVNTIRTGSPIGRSGTPAGAIDLGTQDEKGNPVTIDPAQWIGARRGMRVLGLDAMLTELRRGSDWNTILGKMKEQAVAGWIHPFVGPLPDFVSKVFLGKGISTMRSPFEPAKLEEGGIKQNIEDVRAAAQSLNPMLYGAAHQVAQRVGLTKPHPEEEEAAKVNPLTQFAKPFKSLVGLKSVHPLASPAESEMDRVLKEQMPKMTLQQIEHSRTTHGLLGQLRRQQITPDKLDELVARGRISPADAQRIMDEFQQPPIQVKFKRLGMRDAIRVYSMASPVERMMLKDTFATKYANHLQQSPNDAEEINNLIREKFKVAQ